MCKRMLSNLVEGRIKTQERSMNPSELEHMLEDLKDSKVMMDVEYWVFGEQPVSFIDYSPEVLKELFINAILNPSQGYDTSIWHEAYTGRANERHYIELVKSREEGKRVVMSSRAKIEYTLPKNSQNIKMGLEGLSS